ncbi:6671_t:CDS:2 [Funneliformis geosporum]|nr:6671_t:CDS:2 [Funneliformis geosporum]
MGKKLSKFDHRKNITAVQQREIQSIYCYKGDRKFLNVSNVNYMYPIDDNESDRIQENYNLYRYVWNDNFSAPIKDILNSNNTQVLDIGCGPAMWTLEMATEYPKSRFVGIDIAPTFPIRVKPNNVEFLQENILTGLPHADNTFDYVICRFMMFAFTTKDWEIAIKEICRVCKVGGHIEFMEKDILFWNEGNFTRKARLTCKWGGVLGENYKFIYTWGAKNLKSIMKDCGYNEREWDSVIDKCMKELSENDGYDKIHRFWAQKEELLQHIESYVIEV